MAHVFVGKRSEGHKVLPEADLVAPRATSGKKHFVLFGRKENGWASLHYDTEHTEENVYSGTEGPQPIPPDKSFLRVINIMGNVRLSPLQLRSDHPGTAMIALMEYEQFMHQSLRRGPIHPLPEQLENLIDRSSRAFTEKVMLAAPPILTQLRSMQEECDHNFAEVVERWGQRYQCSAPFSCSGFDVSKVYTCAGDQETGSYFGMVPEDIQGEKQYVEYLATIADNELVKRKKDRPEEGSESGSSEHEGDLLNDEQLLRTDSFLDILTSQASIAAIFYSNDYGILSLLQITFETQEGRVSASYAIDHIGAATRNLEGFIIGMGCCIFLTLAWLMQSAMSLRAAFRVQRSKVLLSFVDPPWWTIGEIVFGVGFLVLLVIILVDKQTVGGRVDDLLERVISIKWEQSSGTFSQKKTAYVEAFGDVSETISGNNLLVNITLVAVMALLSLVVSFTSAHPRIALITKTLYVALSDMVHFALLFAMVFLGFAVIGTWRFGSKRQDLRSVMTTCRAQFDAMLGPPGDLYLASEEADAWEYLFYITAFHFVCFFFLLNFCLAIIIDSYQKVIEEVRDDDTEQDIFSDLYCLIAKKFKALQHCWPSEIKLVEHLEHELNSRFVTTDMLFWAGEDTPGFKTIGDAEAFVEFYGQFNFLTDTEDVVNEQPTLEDVATFQCLTLQKLEQLIRTVKRGQRGATLPTLLSSSDRLSKLIAIETGSS